VKYHLRSASRSGVVHLTFARSQCSLVAMRQLTTSLSRAASILLRRFSFFALRDEWSVLRRTLIETHDRHISGLRHRIPDVVVRALIAGEDHRFSEHDGLDLVAVARAIWRFAVSRRIEGASTIEQQLIRTLSGRREKHFSRKIREIILAIRVSSAIPKEDIPGVYLSVAYFGWHMNGFDAACRHLGLDAKSIDGSQAARLIGRLKHPQPKNPSLNYLRRVSWWAGQIAERLDAGSSSQIETQSATAMVEVTDGGRS
jgi:membrane peptidoglycan carboxypeptidase